MDEKELLKELEESKKREAKIRKNVKIALSSACILIAIFIFMMIPTSHTMSEAHFVKYQEPVYKTIVHNDPVYENKYKIVTHTDPIYKTLYTYILDDEGDGNSAWAYTNVYNIDKTYTGTDFWGNNNYNVNVYYYIGTVKRITSHTEINSVVKSDTYEKITGYNTWTEQVLDGQKITGYDTWSETVIDKYIGKEKTEYRDKEIECLMYEKFWITISED